MRVHVVVICGCGFRADGHTVQEAQRALAEGEIHAESTRHTLDIRGGLRVERAAHINPEPPRDIKPWHRTPFRAQHQIY